MVVLYRYKFYLMTDFGSKDWKDFDFPFFVADATGEDGAGIAAKEILGAAQGEEVFFPGLQGIAALLALVGCLHAHLGVFAQLHQVGVGAVLVALDVEHLAVGAHPQVEVANIGIAGEFLERDDGPRRFAPSRYRSSARW